MTSPAPRSSSTPPSTPPCQHLSISRKKRVLPPVTAAGVGERLISWFECDNCGAAIEPNNPMRFV